MALQAHNPGGPSRTRRNARPSIRPDMPIHPATLSDLPQLAALAMASKAVWGYPPELLAQWRDDLTLTSADLGRWRVRLMRDEQGIAGFYALAPDAADWRLEHLWIAPRALRQGLGRRLLAHAARVARLAGAREIAIEADPQAELFYLAQGAVRVGARAAPIPGAPGRALPLLRLPLNGGPRASVGQAR